MRGDHPARFELRLSHEPIEEPLQILEREAQKAGAKEKVVVLEEGITASSEQHHCPVADTSSANDIC